MFMVVDGRSYEDDSRTDEGRSISADLNLAR